MTEFLPVIEMLGRNRRIARRQTIIFFTDIFIYNICKTHTHTHTHILITLETNK